MGFGGDLMIMLHVVMGFCRVLRGLKVFNGVLKDLVWNFQRFSLDIERFKEDSEGFEGFYVTLKGFSGILNRFTGIW